MWFSVPNGFDGMWAAYAGPLLAFGVSLLVVGLGRLTGGRWLPAAAGALAGWAALVPVQALGAALVSPRTPVDVLLAPAAAAVAAGLLPGRGRLAQWAPWAVLAFAGWWLAGSPAGTREFWRVWAAVVLAGWVLARVVRGEPGRGVAAALALWGGLAMAGAPPVWASASLVLVAAGVALLAGRTALPAVLLAVAAAGAALGAGRMVRGGFGGTDAAALGMVAAPLLLPVVRARMGRLRKAGPALAVPVAAALAVAGVWCAVRVLRG